MSTACGDDEYDLTEEEEAELEEAMAEIERGEWIDGDVVQQELCRRRQWPEVQLTAEQMAELDAAIAEADRGELIPAEEVLRELRAITDEFVRRGSSRS